MELNKYSNQMKVTPRVAPRSIGVDVSNRSKGVGADVSFNKSKIDGFSVDGFKNNGKTTTSAGASFDRKGRFNGGAIRTDFQASKKTSYSSQANFNHKGRITGGEISRTNGNLTTSLSANKDGKHKSTSISLNYRF